MITTIDGVVKKDGQYVYICGIRINSEKGISMKETRTRYFDASKWPGNQLFFHDKKLCAEQCRLMSQDNKI